MLVGVVLLAALRRPAVRPTASALAPTRPMAPMCLGGRPILLFLGRNTTLLVPVLPRPTEPLLPFGFFNARRRPVFIIASLP